MKTAYEKRVDAIGNGYVAITTIVRGVIVSEEVIKKSELK